MQLEVLQADVTKERSPIADRASTAPRLSLGEAVETTAGDMQARWVIHAATMELGCPTSAHEPRTLERVVIAVHGDAAERAFQDALA